MAVEDKMKTTPVRPLPASAPASADSQSSTADRQIKGPSFLTALLSGGVAGTSVDVALFPLDTIKTRLQSGSFWKAGGFRGIYNGLGATALGSAPGAALFFSTYEGLKPVFAGQLGMLGLHDHLALSHMLAASVGEAMACLVRVPTEVVKTKMQTSSQLLSLSQTVRIILQETHGGSWLTHWLGGLYRGYGITLFREIPFAIIQFPLYEKFKVLWSESQSHPVSPVQAAACGSFSGAIAGGLTTPLDVLKTRLMLGVDSHGQAYHGVRDVLERTLQHDGYRALWSGIQPRVFWISLGGFVFFWSYEFSKSMIQPICG